MLLDDRFPTMSRFFLCFLLDFSVRHYGGMEGTEPQFFSSLVSLYVKLKQYLGKWIDNVVIVLMLWSRHNAQP